MAKSFKQSAERPAPASSPLVSVGPDFFDMVASTGRPVEEPIVASTPEPSPPVAPLPVAETPPKAKPASSRRKTQPTGNTPLPGLPIPAPRELSDPGPDIRQTFVVGEYRLEQLRDYVHARRSAGDYHFSQKQALDEAVAEYLAARPLAPPRPEEARAWEQQFRDRIHQGRHAGKTPTADQSEH